MADNEPATKHDTTEGGVIGAVGGAIVGALAGGPVGAVIGAVVGGAASAAAVHQVDKHDHDYTGTEYHNSADDVIDDTAVVTTDHGTTNNYAVAPAVPLTPTARIIPGTTGHMQTLNEETGYKAATTMRDNGDQVVIPIVEEELQVGKRVEQTGGAHIHTDVIETPVTESVNLRDEHVTVERVAVDRPATDADFRTAATDISMIETREVPVIAKEARVVEEVVVGKTTTERTETVSDTVRKTDVVVDNVNGKTV